MTEAFAAIGLASSIVAFVDFAQKVVSRLNEFSNDFNDGTNALIQIQTRLPIITDGLRRIKDRADSGKLDEKAKATLYPIVLACHRQTKLLSDTLDSALPAPDASKWERRRKAIQSLATDSKVKKASEILGQHLQTLTFYHSIGEPWPESVVKKSYWLVPFDRNSNFVGRDSLFREIDHAFKVSEGTQPKVALHGLGGIGKSQIALEYCFRQRHQTLTPSVFWVNAATVARFEESFQRMAKEFGINDREDAQQDSLMLVKSWLETKLLDPWIMVIDNVDDKTAFFLEKCQNGRAPSQAIPHCPHGRLFFTSRTRDVAFDLANPKPPISVESLTREEGLELLRKRLGPDPPEAHLLDLLSELSYIPLAVTQAISFIMKRRTSVQHYLELYRMDDESRIRLLRYEFLDHGRLEQTMESVAKTWQISFEWIKQNHARAAEVLCLMSFYQHHGVPEALLRSDDCSAFEFEDSISVLQAFSLLDLNQSGSSHSTHRLIQVATKLWLEQNGEEKFEGWALRALNQVAISFPDPVDDLKDDYWENCQSLLPHADIVLKQRFNRTKRASDLEKAQLLLRTGYYSAEVGSNLGDVRSLFKTSLEIRQRHLGPEHPDTWYSMKHYFRSLISVDVAYPTGVDSQRVAEMGHALLDHEYEVFGPRHPNTIDSLSDLGMFLSKQGQFKDSEKMQRDALKLSEEVKGRTHSVTAHCMDLLGSVLYKMDRFDEALEVWTESTRIMTEHFGPEHRRVLLVKSDLAACLSRSGRQDEAISMLREIMRLMEKVFGADHPRTLVSARNLASFLAYEGSFTEALGIVDDILNTIQASGRVYSYGYLTTQRISDLKLKIEHDVARKQPELIEFGSNLSEGSAAAEEQL